MLAPCEQRSTEQAMEKAPIERLEDFIKIVVVAFGGRDFFTSARLADAFCLPQHRVARREAAIARVVRWIERFTVKLGEQDVRDCAQNIVWCAFKKIREVDFDLTFAKTNGRVQTGKAIETDMNGRDRSAWTNGTILLFKQTQKLWTH